jgi:preprotein translocase subunit YajC
MHTVFHLGIQIVFVMVIAVLFTVFVVVRPDAKRTLSRSKLLGIACVGLLIGLVFLSTSSLYATPNGL